MSENKRKYPKNFEKNKIVFVITSHRYRDGRHFENKLGHVTALVVDKNSAALGTPHGWTLYKGRVPVPACVCGMCVCVCTYVCLRERICLVASDFILLPIMLITTFS